MFMFLIQKRILIEVNLDFMVSGHSYLPCDRGFGNIEQSCKKKEIINGPEHYKEIISKIKNTVVHQMKQEEFLDIKSLKKRITMRTTKVPGFLFSKARSIVLSKDNKFQFMLILAEGSVMVDLKRKNKRELISHEPISKKYSHGEAIRISEEKVKDVKHFNDFLTMAGRNWISKIVRGQTTARNRPQVDPEHEVTHPENIQDDDQFQDYVPVPPPVGEEDLQDDSEGDSRVADEEDQADHEAEDRVESNGDMFPEDL